MSIADDAAPSTLGSNGTEVNAEASANDDDNSSYLTSTESYMAYKEGMSFYGKQGADMLSDGFTDYTKSVNNTHTKNIRNTFTFFFSHNKT